MPLESRVNQIDFINNMEQVQNLLDTTKAQVTCWGTRLVELTEEDGSLSSVSLDAIACKVVGASRSRSGTTMPIEDQIAQQKIKETVYCFYQKTDTQKNSNFFKKIMIWIREINEFVARVLGFPSYTSRWWIEFDCTDMGGNFQKKSELMELMR